MIGTAPPRRSVLAKCRAKSNAARINPTAKMPTIGAVPVKQPSARSLPPPNGPTTLLAGVRTLSSRNTGSKCARFPAPLSPPCNKLVIRRMRVVRARNTITDI